MRRHLCLIVLAKAISDNAIDTNTMTMTMIKLKKMPSTQTMTQRGFTLTELLITLSLVAIISSIAMPSFVNSIARNKASTDRDVILSAITLAKSEAIKNGRAAVVCPWNGTQCDTAGAAGWMVYSISTANNLTVQETIKVFEKPTDMAVTESDTANGIVVSEPMGAGNWIVFTSTGRSLWDGELTFCREGDVTTTPPRISLSATGFARADEGGAACG